MVAFALEPVPRSGLSNSICISSGTFDLTQLPEIFLVLTMSRPLIKPFVMLPLPTSKS